MPWRTAIFIALVTVGPTLFAARPDARPAENDNAYAQRIKADLDACLAELDSAKTRAELEARLLQQTEELYKLRQSCDRVVHTSCTFGPTNAELVSRVRHSMMAGRFNDAITVTGWIHRRDPGNRWASAAVWSFERFHAILIVAGAVLWAGYIYLERSLRC